MKAWLQLFRFPNLLTVPGDPLAAFLIATGGHLDLRVWPAIGASLCLYAAGLAMNDLADLKEDQRERPNRPLASGAVSTSAAWGAVIALSVGALALLSWAAGNFATTVGIGLLVHIALYNFLTKRIPFIGALNMGVCRALSVALGAVVGAGPDVMFLAVTNCVAVVEPILGIMLTPLAWPRGDMLMNMGLYAGVAIGLYIMAVTNLARYETHESYPRLARLLPLGTLLLGYLALKQVTRPILLDQSPTLWVVAIVLCAMNTSQLMRVPAPPLPPRIGSFIRILPVMQAALCLIPDVPTALRKTPDSLICAVLLLMCVPLHAWLGKRFYAS
jgi:hypothetical protein